MRKKTNMAVYTTVIITIMLSAMANVQAQNFTFFDSLAMEQVIEEEKSYKLSDMPKSVNVNYYTEVTNMSPKTGLSISYSTPGYVGDFEIGGFYQASNNSGQDQPQQPDFERSFYGLFASCTLIQSRAVELDLQVRSGLVNNEHFRIVPAILGKVSVIDRLSFNAGLGTRTMSLTLLGGLTWKFK